MRFRLLGSKAAVLGFLGFVAGAVLVGAGTLVAAPAAGTFGAFTTGQLATAMLGAGTYLGLLSVMMLGLGALLRRGRDRGVRVALRIASDLAAVHRGRGAGYAALRGGVS